MSPPSHKQHYLLPEKVRYIRQRGTRYDGNTFYNFKCRMLLVSSTLYLIPCEALNLLHISCENRKSFVFVAVLGVRITTMKLCLCTTHGKQYKV